MTPDIREKAERLLDQVSDAMFHDGASPEKVADLLAQALLEAHKAGREEMRREAAKACPEPYHICEPRSGWRRRDSFTAVELRRLWPIAETLALLDGNAFFTMGGKYQYDLTLSYMPEAAAIYEANGGENGWAVEALLGDRLPTEEALASAIRSLP